ncbi:hypothetical protein AN958_12426 [Leucoagaricus sp. SymC.cos]|nr:hypothetical protein AN958_12426 [Leucoagaricus sp. SymC.cos]
MTVVKDTLKHLLTQLTSKGIKLVTHIGLHPISNPNLLGDDGGPKNWCFFKGIWMGTVEMDQICVLLIEWEWVTLETAVQGELKTRRELTEDVEQGIIVEPLTIQGPRTLWLVLDDLIDPSIVGPDKRRVIKKVERSNMSEETIRAEVLQREIDKLYTQLDMSATGAKLHKEIRKYFTDHTSRVKPLLLQMDDENEALWKRKEAAATFQHEYLLFRKTMWSFFEAIENLHVPIGRHLQEFYGFNVDQVVRGMTPSSIKTLTKLQASFLKERLNLLYKNINKLNKVIDLKLPEFGSSMPLEWRSASVLDNCDVFYINPFPNRFSYSTVY